MNDFKPEEPKYKGDGVAVWVGKTKEGKTMLTIKVLNSITLKAFKHEPKPKDAAQEEL